MASGQTTNYNLNQWEAGDQVLRTEFNEDNAKIDGALRNLQSAGEALSARLDTETEALDTRLDTTAASIPKIVSGTYVGNGAATQTISLGFAPKAVWLCTASGLTMTSSYYYGGLALREKPVVIYGMTLLELTGNGFRVAYNNETGNVILANYKDQEMRYIAFG